MKKLLLVLFVVLLPVSAFCQDGYCGLRYGESFAEARKTLEDKGYLMIFNRAELRKFAIDPTSDAFDVDLVIDPATETLAGWIVYFDVELPDESQTAAIERLKQLHGAHFVEDPESGILGAPLGEGRAVSVAFDDNGNLALFVYFDEARQDLFDASTARNDEWQALNAED